MQNKPLLLVFVVLGLALAAMVFWPGGDAPSLDPSTTGNGDSPGTAAAAAAGQASEIATGGSSAQPAGVDANAGQAVRSAVEGVPAAAPAGRAATMSGRLVDTAGAPVGQVALSYRTWINPDGAEFFMRRGDDSPRHDLEIGADGRFEFVLGGEDSAALSLVDERFVFDGVPPMLHGHQGDRDLGDLVLHRSAAVSGIVRNERGEPIADVRVSAVEGVLAFGTTSESTTAADGTFHIGRMHAGTWTLRTASARYLPLSEEVVVAAGQHLDSLVLTVAEGRAISGQVVDDRGRPVAAIKVGAKRAEANGGVDIERFSSDEATTTDDSGLFTLSGLDGETATVRAYGDGYSTALAVDVNVGTGNLLLRVDRLAVIEGTLQAMDGTPLAGSRVRAVAASGGLSLGAHGIEGLMQGRGGSATTAADGTFRIEGVKPGSVTVKAEGDLHRPVEKVGVLVRPAATIKDVRLVASRGATARVTVVDDDGQPVAGAKVIAEAPPQQDPANGHAFRGRGVRAEAGSVRVFDSSAPLAEAKTGADGVATITGLADGSMVFRAEHEEFAPAQPVTLPLLPNGTIEVGLTMMTPGFADLHVVQTDGTSAGGARFRVRARDGENGDGKSGVCDSEGKALVGPLAAGRYVAELVRAVEGTMIGSASFVISGDEGGAIGGSQQNFIITAGNTTPVVVRRPVLTKVFGVVTGADGLVAECNVQLDKDDPQQPAIPGMGTGRSVTTGADGSFAIEDVEPGRYKVTYGRPDHIVKAEHAFTVPPDTPELRQDLVLRTGKIRVQAWSATEDRPIANAEVEVRRPRPPSGERQQTRMVMVTISTSDSDSGDSTMVTIGAQRVKTGPDGWAEVDGVPVGDYQVHLTHDAHSPAEQDGVAVQELQVTDVGRVEMSPAGGIRGKVLADDGGAVQMAMVSHRPKGGEAGQPTPAMGGAFKLDALSPGRYVLRAQALSFGGGGPGEFGPEVEVGVIAGKQATVELRLPAK